MEDANEKIESYVEKLEKDLDKRKESLKRKGEMLSVMLEFIPDLIGVKGMLKYNEISLKIGEIMDRYVVCMHTDTEQSQRIENFVEEIASLVTTFMKQENIKGD